MDTDLDTLATALYVRVDDPTPPPFTALLVVLARCRCRRAVVPEAIGIVRLFPRR